MKTVIIYGSTTGATEAVAQDVASAFAGAALYAASEVTEADLQGVDLLILGASTWGCGDLQDDMDAFLSQFRSWTVEVKSGAVFGLGDQVGFSDSYVDGMADLAAALRDQGIALVGRCSAVGYSHGASRAQEGDEFVGLALDQENEFDQTAARIAAWTEAVRQAVGA